MPPTSTNIFQEGAHIVSFKVVSQGKFDEEGLYKYMVEEPAKYGFKISNNSKVPLYAALFYFDASDLSVGTCLSVIMFVVHY